MDESEMSEEQNEDGQGQGAKRRRPIDIVIAEKNPLLMSSLIKLFAGDERFTLVATTPDGERFLSAVDRLSFDVGIIGWEMPYMDGRGVLQAAPARKFPALRWRWGRRGSVQSLTLRRSCSKRWPRWPMGG
jgi:hypothetical protein